MHYLLHVSVFSCIHSVYSSLGLNDAYKCLHQFLQVFTYMDGMNVCVLLVYSALNIKWMSLCACYRPLLVAFGCTTNVSLIIYAHILQALRTDAVL